MADASRERSARGRDIGEIPECRNPERRERALASFRGFLETYFPRVFSIAWSPDHIAFLEACEKVLTVGGRLAQAMPRGNGKTMVLVRAPTYAALKGLRRYPVMVGGTGPLASGLLRFAKSDIETNELLFEDFPEVCYPVRCLGGMPQRCHGQLCRGERTRMEWSNDRIVLPTIPHRGASAVVIEAASIEGAIRGLNYPLPDGAAIRPDVAIIDDPQTRESAKSVSQCEARSQIIEGDVLGLAGPEVEMAAFLGCTVIERGDLADRYLDRAQKPEWKGVRCKAIVTFPTDTERWDEWWRRRRASLEAGGEGEEADAMYLEERAAMDAGAVLSWPERVPKGSASALVALMRHYYEDRPAFFAERQNAPEAPGGDSAETAIDAAQVMRRTNGVKRGYVPAWATKLTGFVDVQKNSLWWLVAAWGQDFTGAVVDYGVVPEQKGEYFRQRDLRRTFAHAYPAMDLPGQIYAALTALLPSLAGRDWPGATGEKFRMSRLLIDANYGDSTTSVHRACEASAFGSVVMPCHGRPVGAADRPMSDWTAKEGERIGLQWILRPPTRGRTRRHVAFDVNFWKSFCAHRLATAIGSAGALTLPGLDPNAHRMLADQLASERPVQVESRGRKIDEWRIVQAGRDNHWLDGLVGAAVAASEQGIALPGTGPKPKPPRKRFSEIVRRKRAAR